MKKCRNCFTEFYSAVIIAGMKNTILSPEWVTDKFILIMLAVFPLWVGFDGYSNVTLSKFLFFVICTGLWLLLALLVTALCTAALYLWGRRLCRDGSFN